MTRETKVFAIKVAAVAASVVGYMFMVGMTFGYISAQETVRGPDYQLPPASLAIAWPLYWPAHFGNMMAEE